MLLVLLSGLWQSFGASRTQSSGSTYLLWFKPVFHVEGRWFPSRDQSARGIAMTATLGSCSARMLQKFHGTGCKKKMQTSSLKQNAILQKVGLILFIPTGLRVQAIKRRALGLDTSKETSRSLCMWSLHTTCSYKLCDCLILAIRIRLFHDKIRGEGFSTFYFKVTLNVHPEIKPVMLWIVQTS